MISGIVSEEGVPTIIVPVAGQDWTAIIDTGFNGDLELPESLRGYVSERYVGQVTSALAGGQLIEEEAYQVHFPFDGEIVRADATFAGDGDILVGTRMLRQYRLTVDFVDRSVTLDRLQSSGLP